ncbi:MAG: hypothetical protein ABSF89_16065 [Acidimicrobiales bacterium]
MTAETTRRSGPSLTIVLSSTSSPTIAASASSPVSAGRQLQSVAEHAHRFHDSVVAAVAAVALTVGAIMQAEPGRTRDYVAIYRRRLERRPGKSAREATGHGTRSRRVTTTTAGDRRFAEVAARNRALDAVSRMRRDGVSLTRGARDARTTPDAVRRYAGSALDRRGSRWVAKPSDRLLRRQFTTIVGPGGGPEEALVETRSSRQASEIGRHNADASIFFSASASPVAKREARARLVRRHGKRAGLRAVLSDGTIVTNPMFYGDPDGMEHLAAETDLSDLDYGSDPPTRFSG